MKDKKLLSFILIVFIAFVTIYLGPISDSSSNDIKRRENLDTEPVISDGSKTLTVSFIDVGQADCILIESDNKFFLIDAGNNQDGKKLVNYFKSLGITNFSYVVATHAHEDHIGGMDDVIKNFNIDNFYMPDVITTTKTFEDVLDALEEKQIPIKVPEVSSEFSFGDSKIKVIAVSSDSKDLNDSSIVLRLTYGITSFLFTGDISSKVEKELIDKNIKSDLLKVAHHGSRYSSSASFLDKVDPLYAVISVGKNNNYNHPHNSTLTRLENRGIKVFRTDISGTIKAISNGSIIRIETGKTDTNG